MAPDLRRWSRTLGLEGNRDHRVSYCRRSDLAMGGRPPERAAAAPGRTGSGGRAAGRRGVLRSVRGVLRSADRPAVHADGGLPAVDVPEVPVPAGLRDAVPRSERFVHVAAVLPDPVRRCGAAPNHVDEADHPEPTSSGSRRPAARSAATCGIGPGRPERKRTAWRRGCGPARRWAATRPRPGCRRSPGSWPAWPNRRSRTRGRCWSTPAARPTGPAPGLLSWPRQAWLTRPLVGAADGWSGLSGAVVGRGKWPGLIELVGVSLVTVSGS